MKFSFLFFHQISIKPLACAWLCMIQFSMVRAQTSALYAGVYVHASDLAKGNPLPDTAATCVKSNQLFRPGYIEVSSHGKHFNYHKDSVWGYRDEAGNLFRIDPLTKTALRILEIRNIVVYMGYAPTHGNKTFIHVPVYYFSTTTESNIQPLSLINIKRAFPDNYVLHHHLDLEFYDNSITGYDEIHQMFRVNYIIQSSLNLSH